jgi:predicted AlkP superfamily phosphohydrolase/phosphomutase
MSRRATFFAAVICLLVIASASIYFLPRMRKQPPPKILLIGIDGGSWDVLTELMAQGRLPHFKKLVQEGSAGYLNSFIWRELMQGTKGYFSPIVWASISTGKWPSKHGVEDFTMPLPSQMIASILPNSSQGYAYVRLPKMATAETRMLLKLKSRNGRPIKITAYFNQKPVQEIEAGKDWKDVVVNLPASLFQTENQLSFYYETDASNVGMPLVDFNYIRFYDVFGEELLDLQFLRERNSFGEGWEIKKPEGDTLVSSFHLRAKTLWDIFSQNKRRVGVVGWWETWPAVPVNGYIVSSHVGEQGARIRLLQGQWMSKIKDLVYPAEYQKEIEAKMFMPDSLNDEIRKRFYDIGNCACVGSQQDKIFRDFFWQDKLFAQISDDLMRRKGPFDLFAVYFRGTDSSGHQFLRFRDDVNAAANSDCGSCDRARLPQIVDKYYEYMDEVIGQLLQDADRNTATIIVTDHGQFLQGSQGIHQNNGFIILHGRPFRPHVISQAHVLDIAPTILYLEGLPVAQDMDGKVLVEAFHPEFLRRNPLTFRATYEDRRGQKQKPEVVNEELNRENREKLKALGYVSD